MNDIDVTQTARFFARVIEQVTRQDPARELTEVELVTTLRQFYRATNRGDVLSVSDAFEYVFGVR
jgi:hypothetical protein